MSMSGKAIVTGVAALLLGADVANAAGNETGDWVVRAGASVVAPESDNGRLDLSNVGLPDSDIDVDDGASFTFTVSYFLTPQVAVELLAAYPFTHDYTLEDLSVDGELDHLPPTLSLQYHFAFSETVRPYVGAGVNWTLFSNEDIEAPVDVSVDDSVGVALQAGIDVELGSNWLINVDLRWMNIEGDVEVEGVDVGTVDVNPLVYGLNVGYRL